MLLPQKTQAALRHFIQTENLPASYLQDVEKWYVPLVQDLSQKITEHQGTFVLGIHGCQGSGKSTLASLLVILFQEMLDLRSINLSLDDFYLRLTEREKLAANIHPLLITRGVPGTHDVDLALDVLKALKQPGSVAIPRFDKAIDDRVAEFDWQQVDGPVDVIILEGWCLGVGPQQDKELEEAINELEAKEDKGVWRNYVNDKLANEYQELFKMLDMLLMLKAPDFSNILDWRLQQEEKLKEKSKHVGDAKLMSKDELIRFISHYERLSRHALQTVPAKADVVYQLNDQQGIEAKLKA